jgi:hypothetical protein
MTRATSIDLTGQRFGRLLVEFPAPPLGGKRRWACLCDCGARSTPHQHSLRSGSTLSCGCASRSGRPGVHGEARNRQRTREYYSWSSMISRCSDASNPRYGGRGVAICDRWRGVDGYVNFLADMGRRPDGTTLDRKDPHGNYEPANCRWATPKVQRANQRPRNAAHTRAGSLCVAYLAARGAHIQTLASSFGISREFVRGLAKRLRHEFAAADELSLDVLPGVP